MIKLLLATYPAFPEIFSELFFALKKNLIGDESQALKAQT